MEESNHDIAQQSKNTDRKALEGQWVCQCGITYLYAVTGHGRTADVEWYEKKNDGSRGRELGICPDCRVPLVFFRKKVVEQIQAASVKAEGL